jgi:citrate lyase subunit beta-like protein
MLSKAGALQVDTLIYDLEDSVAPDLKTEARHLVSRHIAASPQRQRSEVAVRINAVDTGLALDDLTSLVSLGHATPAPNHKSHGRHV